MRIDLPAEHRSDPIPHLADAYAAAIVRAALDFSKTTYQYSKLSLREFEGSRARTAEINCCRLCMNFRGESDIPAYLEAVGGSAAQSVAARGPAPDESFYRNVANWRNHPAFSKRERLAIEYAELLAHNPKGVAADEDFWKRLKAEFQDDEIVDLSYCIGCWLGLGRVTHALGLDGTCSFVAKTRVA